jgi:hypothetical protein
MNCEDLPWREGLQRHDSKFSELGLVALRPMLFKKEGRTEGGCPLILTFSPIGGEGIYWRCLVWTMKATKAAKFSMEQLFNSLSDSKSSKQLSLAVLPMRNAQKCLTGSIQIN